MSFVIKLKQKTKSNSKLPCPAAKTYALNGSLSSFQGHNSKFPSTVLPISNKYTPPQGGFSLQNAPCFCPLNEILTKAGIDNHRANILSERGGHLTEYEDSKVVHALGNDAAG